MKGFLLRSDQLRTYSEALDRLYAPVMLEEFPRLLMEVANRVIACAGISFNEVNLATKEIRVEWIGTMMEEVVGNWPPFAHEHPGIAHVTAGGPLRVFAITDFMSQRQFRRTGLYAHVFEPLGFKAQLAAVLAPGHSTVGLALNRDSQFSARETQLLELLRPHIVRAFNQARVRTASKLPRPAKPEPDFLLCRRAGLTRRECEILRWLTEGKRDSEIAIILKLSRRTVNNHVGSILRKLGVENRTTAVTRALELLR